MAYLTGFPTGGGRITYPIDQSGSEGDWTAISAALTECAGGVLAFPPGTTPLYTAIAPAASTTITSLSGRTATLHDPNGNAILVDTAANDDVSVRSINFTGSGVLGTAGRGAIKATGGSRLLVEDVLVDGCGTCGVSGYMVESRIDGLTVVGGAEHGLYLSTGTQDVLVRGLIAKNIGADGGVSTVNGVKLADADGVVIEDYVIAGSKTSGIAKSGTGTVIIGRGVIRDSGNWGIRVVDGPPAIVSPEVLLSNNPTADIAGDVTRVADVQSITGATDAERVTSLIAALVDLGVATDDTT